MPSAEALDLVTRWMDLYEAGDLDAQIERFDEFCAPEFEMTLKTGLGAERFSGRDAIRQYRDNLRAHFREARLEEPDEVQVIGEDGVLSLGRARLEGRASGVPVQQEYGIVFRVERGRLASIQVFDSHAEAHAVAEALHA